MLGKEFRLLIIALLVLVFAICRGIILAAGSGGEVGVIIGAAIGAGIGAGGGAVAVLAVSLI